MQLSTARAGNVIGGGDSAKNRLLPDLVRAGQEGAFIKLMPFIIFKTIFSRSIYISQKINIESVNWKNSLSLKRYSVKRNDILSKIDSIK